MFIYQFYGLSAFKIMTLMNCTN